MRFRLLGPLEVLDDAGDPVDVGGRQPRILLAVLLAASGRRVTPDVIADAIWGDQLPASATGTLQSYVSRLRRRFSAQLPLRWDEAGYRLEVDAADVDFRRFEALADEGRALLEAGKVEEARSLLAEAEALWRGPALVEFADLPFASGLAARLDERRLAAIEARLAADLQLGRHTAAAGELTELVQAHPLREGLQAQLALALYRSGRQADALRAIAQAGRTLREELGIEPSRQLRDLEGAILAHDPSIELPAVAPVTAAAPPGHGVQATQAAAGIPVPRRPSLIGRDAELAQLVAALEESAAESRFAVIEGEPGIGKTRLADELRAVAAERGALTVWGRSDEGGAAPALWPWLAPLRVIAERAGELPAALAELLAGEVPMSAGLAQAAQFDRFEAVAGVLGAVAAETPVVILLDDLQWADGTSLELLEFLATRLAPGVLVVGTVRQLEVGRNDAVTKALATIARRPGSRRLPLRGLTETATAAVLEAAADQPVPATVAAAIHARAEGNPFYAIELSRLAGDEGGAMTGLRGLNAIEVPGSVGDVIRRRLAHLPPDTVELLGVAAVVGRDVEMNLLAAAAGRGLDEVLDGIEPAVVHRLLVEVPDAPAVLRFSHALVRQVLLDDLTALRRARLHLKVADALEARGAGVDDAEILAEHLWRASPVGVGRRAAEALERAAEVALRRVSYGAAEELLLKAVQLRRATGTTLADQEAELLAIYRLLEVARALRYFQGATNLDVTGRAKELAERCGRRDVLLEMIWFEWSALATSCRAEEAALLAKALMDLTADDPRPEVRATGHQVYTVLCWGAGRIAEAVEHADIVVGLLEQAPPPADGFAAEQRLVSQCFWIFNHAQHGDLSPKEAFGHFDDLVAAVQPERFAIASLCGFAATLALVLGDWDEVERFAETSATADPGSQFAFWGGQVLMQRGIVHAWRGDADQGLAEFARGRAQYTGIGGRSGMGTFLASMALALAHRERLADARRLAADARTEFDTYREGWNEPIVLIAEAVVAAATGDADRAAERLATAERRATEQGAHGVAARAQTTVLSSSS